MTTARRSNKAYQWVIGIVPILRDHYIECEKWRKTAKLPNGIATINRLFGLIFPSLNTTSAGVETYIRNYHQAVIDFLTNVGVFMANQVGDVGYNAAMNNILTIFNNFDQDLSINKPFRCWYVPTTFVKFSGLVDFGIIPDEVVDLRDVCRDVLTANVNTTVYVRMTTAGAYPVTDQGIGGAANYGGPDPLDTVLGAWPNVSNRTLAEALYLPNTGIAFLTGIEQALFVNGSQHDLSIIDERNFAQPGTQEVATLLYYLTNDIYRVLIKEIEPYLIALENGWRRF